VGVLARVSGRSPREAKRRRSVRMRERSRRARAKSVARVSRRPEVLRVEVEGENEGPSAVTIGLTRNSRDEPRLGIGLDRLSRT